jgi:hypothetical protein
MDRKINARIESGLCTNPSEQEDELKLKALRAAVLAGEESGFAEGDVMGEVRERIRRRALVVGAV